MIYRKGTNKNWSLDILENSDDILELKSMEIDLDLKHIYEDIIPNPV